MIVLGGNLLLHKEGIKMSKTIDYYNKNAQGFYDRTINLDLLKSYKTFLGYLPHQAYILDAGCGVGRDAKYFLNHGYAVAAFDASKEMVRITSEIAGLDVQHMVFQDMNFNQQFDGIWAQASLLHIPYSQTRMIYQKIHQSLKPKGVFYASYKYGQDYMPTPERDFWHMNEEKVKPYLEGIFEILELWTEKDTRSKVSPSQEGMWLNFIVRKKPL